MAPLASLKLLLALGCLIGVYAKKQMMEKMYLEHKTLSDLDSSASGYIYRSDSHGPSSYIHLGDSGLYGGSGEHHHYAPIPVAHYVHHEIPHSSQYYYHAPEKLVNEEVEEFSPGEFEHGLAGVDAEAAKYSYDGNENVGEGVFKNEGLAASPMAGVGAGTFGSGTLGVLKTQELESFGTPVGGGSGVSSGGGGGSELESTGFEKSGGEKFNEGHHASEGEKGNKGYNSKHGFEKGAQGKHDKEGHKGYYDEASGKKGSHGDEAAYYGQHHAASKGAKGENFHESKGHKKGSKTTGFHNVYHKDEYKKDHTFYDESDNSGHHEKYGGGHAQHSEGEGAYEKGGKSDSAFYDANQGKKGSFNKGHFLDTAKGFKGEHGQDGYHNEHEDYGKKSGSSEGSQFGYSNGQGAAGKYYS